MYSQVLFKWTKEDKCKEKKIRINNYLDYEGKIKPSNSF